MSAKQRVLRAIEELPEDAEFSEIREKVAFLAAVEEGEQAYRQGRLVSHQDVKQDLHRWLSKSSGPNLR